MVLMSKRDLKYCPGRKREEEKSQINVKKAQASKLYESQEDTH